jgi:hypothetical protein
MKICTLNEGVERLAKLVEPLSYPIMIGVFAPERQTGKTEFIQRAVPALHLNTRGIVADHGDFFSPDCLNGIDAYFIEYGLPTKPECLPGSITLLDTVLRRDLNHPLDISVYVFRDSNYLQSLYIHAATIPIFNDVRK